MPSRNILKDYMEDSYYHVYNRGTNKRKIFLDKQDYEVFLNLLKRYLSVEPIKDEKGREYEHLYGKVELLAYCLMPNHFHLLLFQTDNKAMERLMRGVLTAYTKYFNKKYGRIGPLFQGRYKASWVNFENYLLHISRYIHLNPKKYLDWEYSSLPYYLNYKRAEWVMPSRIIKMFSNSNEYLKFVKDYEDHKAVLDEIKDYLANGEE